MTRGDTRPWILFAGWQIALIVVPSVLGLTFIAFTLYVQCYRNARNDIDEEHKRYEPSVPCRTRQGEIDEPCRLFGIQY